jgi:hypothetical protein
MRGARNRDQLPQLRGRKFPAGGGLETNLIFLEGVDSADFAAPLLADQSGLERLKRYYETYMTASLKDQRTRRPATTTAAGRRSSEGSSRGSWW